MKPSHAANDNLKDELIRRTRQVWQPRLGRDLSREDARQIVTNVTGFFSVLAEWSRAEMPPPAARTKPKQPDLVQALKDREQYRREREARR